MSAPLETIWNAFRVSEDALSTVRRSGELNPKLDAPHLKETLFDSLDRQDCELLLVKTASELGDLAVVGLFSSFEQAIRELCDQKFEEIGTRLLGANDFEAAASEWWRRQYLPRDMQQMLKLFCPPVSKEIYDETNRVREYRNWVGHGKTGAAKAPISPRFAYAALSQFLKEARRI